MTSPKILARKPGEAAADAIERAGTRPSVALTIPYTSGAQGSANVELFVSQNDGGSGGFVLRILINDADCSWVPSARELPNGVDLHLVGEAEGAALLAAIAGVLASFHAVAGRKDVGV